MDERKEYTESAENKDRRLEISAKFTKMGKTLIFEGRDKDDYCIISAGNLLILMSGLVLKSKEMSEFNNLCSMFTAKGILDDMMNKGGAGMMSDNLMDKLKGGMGAMGGPLSGNMDDISEIMDFLSKNGGGDDDILGDFLKNHGVNDDDDPDGDS